MQPVIEEAASALHALNIIYYLFLSILPYFFFLYWSRFYKKLKTDLSIRKVVHSFYIMLTLLTAFFIFYVTFVFSMPIYVMSGVFFMILLVLLFLLYLRRTQPFQYAVISQELPRLPLVLTILILFMGIGLTYVAMMLEAALLVTGTQVELVVQFMEQHFNQPENTTDQDTNDTDVVVPTPIEKPVSSSSSSRGVGGFFWNLARGFVDDKVVNVIEAPTTEIKKQVYKTVYQGVVTKDTPWVYTPESLKVDAGTASFSAHPVSIKEGDEIRDCTAICFSTSEACKTAANLMPQSKGLVKSAVNSLVLYDSGCILVECPAKGELKLLTDPSIVPLPLVEQLSIPPSPPDHDLQSIGLFR